MAITLETLTKCNEWTNEEINNQNEDYLPGMALRIDDTFITEDISNVITWLKCVYIYIYV